MFLYHNTCISNRDLRYYYNEDTYHVVFPEKDTGKIYYPHRLEETMERMRTCNLSSFPFSNILEEFPFLLFLDRETASFVSSISPVLVHENKSVLVLFSKVDTSYKLDFFLFLIEHFQLENYFETGFYYLITDKAQKVLMQRDQNRMKHCLEYVSNLKRNEKIIENFPKSLSINMKNLGDDRKMNLAILHGEPTLFPGVTLRVKQQLRMNGIFSFYQKDFLRQLKPLLYSKYYRQTERMLDLMQSKSTVSISNTIVNDSQFQKLLQNQHGYVFFDFEYTADLIYMVGLYVVSFQTNISYYIPLVNHHKSDDTCLFREFLRFHRFFEEYVWIFYRAEHGRASRWFREHHEPFEAEHWVDLCTLLQKYCSFEGCFNYRLKTIVEFLNKHGEIENGYETGVCKNGQDTLKSYGEFQLTGDPEILRTIRDYNEKDCYYLNNILQYILKNINKNGL